MEKISNFGIVPFIVLSILIHSLVFWVCFYSKKKQNLFVQVPFEVSFYSPVQNVVETPIVEQIEEKKEEVIEEIKKEEIKEPEIKKDDIVVKKKKKRKEKKKPVEKKVERSKVEQPVAKKETSQQVLSSQGSSQAVPNSKGIMFENKNFKYSYYTNTIVKKIRRYWQWSSVAEVYRAVVYFKILKDGTVSEVRIAESSKSEEFDQNAIRSVQLSSPFAPLPSGYNEDYLGVYFEFKFN